MKTIGIKAYNRNMREYLEAILGHDKRDYIILDKGFESSNGGSIRDVDLMIYEAPHQVEEEYDQAESKKISWFSLYDLPMWLEPISKMP